VEDTRRIQHAIETAIRETPDQWLWIHRRWKTRPEGEPSLYG
jgi:KDO2-lipid IV(A) lauroyltransferase